MKTLKLISQCFLILIVWVALLIFGFSSGQLLRPISGDSPQAFIEETSQLINDEFVGNLGLVVLENGQVADEYYYDIKTDIDRNTVYQVASVSKWVTAFGLFKLVEDGKVDLDTPIDNYLTRWHLPPSDFDNRKVTLRLLLSHSSGLIDDLGYDGFGPDQPVQTIEESLTQAADAEYAAGKAIVGYEPGSQYMYSGAAYTIIQLLIEEVSGKSFQAYMTETVFEPLGMVSSTFDLGTKPELNLATRYNRDGSVAPANRFTALAAASLFTNTSDLAKFMAAHVSPNPVLSASTIQQMIQPQTYINNTPVYALGPHLYSQGDESSQIIGHDGSSGQPTINTAARINMTTGNGIIVLEMGSPNLASRIADEWIFLEGGIADYVVIQRNKPFLMTLLFVGYLILVSTYFLWRSKRTKKAKLT
ncbi:serine hydrolase domain-containing protein [Roseivirga misakiensis]|uniref:Serine hydrolase n=1 Tax=Roseivirga misakiensis TaxID=1563681 RepID=A0A1E5SYM9_9BACT|nr:serine hydrolase [Roseivirga misakiensis]OEK04221.1 serine hydrolase [Roseivirga misakiensis]